MNSVQVLLATLVFICHTGKGQVSFDPNGPLSIPINSQRSINCSSTEGDIDRWIVILSGGTEIGVRAAQRNVERFGITGTFMTTSLQLTVNTSNTEIVGLRCVSAVFNDVGDIIRQNEAEINLTIYGVPDPPAITSLSLEGDSLRSSLDYVRIPTVDAALYWSLSFFGPSQLSNMTTKLINTSTYNYTLDGERSCDPFGLCIRAENDVGNSSWSCTNSALPYIPQIEDIKLLLVRVNETFSLNVTVLVPQECQSSMNSYCLKVTNAEGNKVAKSLCARSDVRQVHLLVEDLNESSAYNFTIISNNSIGKQSTAAVLFSTSCVMGITLCSTNENLYMISCDYVRGCGREICSYTLTSMNNSLTDTIQGSSLIRITDQDIIYHMTVKDMDEIVVQSEEFSFRDIMSCPTTEITTPLNGPPGGSGSGLSAGAIATIVVAAFTALILIATLITTLGLIKLGCCCGKASTKIKRHQSNCEGGVKLIKNDEGLPDVAIGSGNQRGNVPDVAMNADQQDGVSSQEPFYSSLSTTKPATVKAVAPVTTAGGDYAKINEEPVYFVLENDEQNKTPPKEVIPADKDAPPIPEYNPVDDIPAASPAPLPVGGNISTSSAQPEAMYAEIGTRSAAKL